MSKKIYKDYFDIGPMIDEAKNNHVCFVVAVSRDAQRGCGKTFSTASYLYEHFVDEGERFVIFVRHVKELGHIAEGIFGVYLSKNHPEVTIYEKSQEKIFSCIYATSGKGEEKKSDIIGYVCPLKNAGQLKQYRGMLQASNVKYFYMDEFMPVDGVYLKDEPKLMKTIYDTVNGEIEDLPIILTANCISLGNPYFTMLKLNNKIQSNTRKISTDTVMYENVEVEGLEDKHINSAANRAFGMDNEEYLSNVWIGDNDSLKAKPDSTWGHGVYSCTLVYNNNKLAVRKYYNIDYTYINRSIDNGCEYVYNVSLDGDLNIPLLRSSPYLQRLRDDFYAGKVRVSDNGIQRMLLDIFG